MITLIMVLFAVLLGTAMMLAGLVVLGYHAAINKQQASFVREGTIEFVVTGKQPKSDDPNQPQDKGGGALVKTLLNVKGWRFYNSDDPIDYKVTVGEPDLPKKELEEFEKQLRELEGKIRETALKLAGTAPNANERKELEQKLEQLTNQMREKEQVPFRPKQVPVEVRHAIISKDHLQDLIKKTEDNIKEKEKKSPPPQSTLEEIENELKKLAKHKEFLQKLMADPQELDPKKMRSWVTHPVLMLQRHWGFFWVSLFYPAKRIHIIRVLHRRLKHELETDDSSLEKRFETETLDEMFWLWKVQRVILVKGVEFSDGFNASMIVRATFRTVMPYQPVFILKHELYPNLESNISGAVIDYARTRTFSDFIQHTKTGPGSDFFLKVVSGINISMKDVRTANTQQDRGIVQAYGMELVDAWIEDIRLVDKKESDMSETEKALRAQELNRLRGEAKIVEETKRGEAELAYATRRAQAITVVANAQANALGARRNAVIGVEGLLNTELLADALKETEVTTLVLGEKAGIMVSAGEKDTSKAGGGS